MNTNEQKDGEPRFRRGELVELRGIMFRIQSYGRRIMILHEVHQKPVTVEVTK